MARGYTSWRQVAGYFDGDGCPKVHVGDFTIHVTVCWSDQDKELLQHIGLFLAKRGIVWRIGEFHRGTSVYCELSVTEGGGHGLRVLKSMLPFLDKKWSQVDAAVSYLENRSTGDSFIRALNDAVLAKRRSSSLIDVKMPQTKKQGIQLARTREKPNARKLTTEQLFEIKRLRDTLGLSYRKLSEMYGVAESTMFYSLKSHA